MAGQAKNFSSGIRIFQGFPGLSGQKEQVSKMPQLD
jgi:hypothetical protein